MIEESVKIHDKFSIEIKLGFNARRKQKISDFALNTWLFIPNSLDINPSTYDKKEFYRDMKSNIRLITPVFLLRDIAGSKHTPFALLEKSFRNLASNPTRTHIADYGYQIKMFLSILKSALRDDINHIQNNNLVEDKAFLVGGYLESIETITTRFRNLRQIINVPTIKGELYNYFRFADEFMSNIIEQHTFKLLSSLDKIKHKEFSALRKKILHFIQKEIEYKKDKKFKVIEKKEPNRNRDLIFRFGLLKKFAENELFLTANKKRDGILIEQIYYSLAAGVAMVFATAIAFSFQMKYGNFTMPFFVALVVSYMLKDRIKDMGRYYSAHRLVKRYFDHKTKISLKNKLIGWSKEAMDFVSDAKVPAEVIKIRDRSDILEENNKSFSEKIILYRKLVRLYRKKLDESIQFNSSGMNEIIRFNFSGFIFKMDNPEFPLFVPDEDEGYKIIKGERTYYLNLIMQMKHEDQVNYKRYRIVLNREGIRDIEEF